MKRVIIYCEGQTEETFVRDVLQPHFTQYNISPTAINMNGIRSFPSLKNDISRLCKKDNSATITSLIDLYGLPKNYHDDIANYNNLLPMQKAQAIEAKLKQEIDQRNFTPNVVIHEVEALLFSNIEQFKIFFPEDQVQNLADEIEQYETPEHVNDRRESAPSKRIKKHIPRYDKTLHGSQIAQAIGLANIREKCPHFNQWLKTIENLGTVN
jgi:hypothetical protein